MPAQGLNPDR